jgi:hypothetical protein
MYSIIGLILYLLNILFFYLNSSAAYHESTLAHTVISYICGLIIPIITLVLCIIGLREAIKSHHKGKIAISIISIVIPLGILGFGILFGLAIRFGGPG